MKNRYRYAILFGIPGLFVTALLTAVFLGVAAGFLWLFVFGDSRWPDATQTFLPTGALIVFLAAWMGIVIWGYHFGKAREDGRPIDRCHLLLAAGATFLPIIIAILHQYRVGNLGAKSDTEKCSNFCMEQGYDTSGMPPKISGDRSCLCYDGKGQVILKRPLDSLSVDR